VGLARPMTPIGFRHAGRRRQAPLTGEQMLAEQAMLAMTTEEFWEQAARDNGIADMTTVAEARGQAVKDVNEEFLTADFQI
jgi:hypothetical protein